MKLRGATERAIYAAAYVAAFARMHGLGVHAEFRRRAQEGTITLDRVVAEWEAWCAECAIDAAIGIVNLHRRGRRAR